MPLCMPGLCLFAAPGDLTRKNGKTGARMHRGRLRGLGLFSVDTDLRSGPDHPDSHRHVRGEGLLRAAVSQRQLRP